MRRWKNGKSIDQDGNLTRYKTNFQITIKEGEENEKNKINKLAIKNENYLKSKYIIIIINNRCDRFKIQVNLRRVR